MNTIRNTTAAALSLTTVTTLVGLQPAEAASNCIPSDNIGRAVASQVSANFTVKAAKDALSAADIRARELARSEAIAFREYQRARANKRSKAKQAALREYGRAKAARIAAQDALAAAQLRMTTVTAQVRAEVESHLTAYICTTSTALSVQAVAGNDQVTLSWIPVTGADKYIIRRDGVVIASTSNSHYVDLSSGNGISHNYTVYALTSSNPAGTNAAPQFNDPVEEPTSTVLTSDTVTAEGVLPPPSAIDVIAGRGYLHVFWSAVPNATQYEVYRNGSLVTTTTKRSYTDNAIERGVSYGYSIVALDGTHASAPSALVSASFAPLVLGIPDGVVAEAGNDQVLLSWNEVLNATAYKVFRNGTYFATLSTTSFVDLSAHNGTSYSYTVVATADTAESDASAAVVASPQLPSVTGLLANAGDARVSLSWNSVAHASLYRVIRDGAIVATTSGTSYIDNSVVNGTSYSYTVQAVEGSAASAVAAAVTAAPFSTFVAAPTGLTASAGEASVSLSWTAVSGATSYQVLRNGVLLASTTASSYSDTAVTEGVTYSYTVKALRGAYESSPTAPVLATPTALTVAAPTGLAAVAGDTKVTLSWTAVPEATSYELLRNGVVIQTLTATSYVDTAVTNGTTYTYTVRTVSGARSSVASAPVTATPAGLVVPAPSGLVAVAADASVSLSWSVVSGASSYDVFRDGLLIASPTTTSFTDTSVTNGTTYSYTVKAVSNGVSSVASAAATATPQVAAPTAPTGLVATAGNAQVSLSWTAVAGATSYQVLRNGVSVGSVSITSFTDTGLINGTAYSYTVKAVNAGGSSAASAAATATPLPAAPAAPVGLVATAGNAQVVLTWTATTGATSYQVLRNGVQIGTSASATYTDTTVTNGTAYSYTVKAVNAGGTSAASAAVSATPQLPAPSAPSGLAATAGDAQVALTWTATATATSYLVFRDGVQVGAPTVNAFTDTALTNGTAYSYTVKAVNAGGTSAASAAVTATPASATLAAPTGLVANTATSLNTGAFRLAWTAVTGASSYKVYKDGVLATTVTTTNYTPATPASGVASTYYVVAVSAAGTSSPASATVTAGLYVGNGVADALGRTSYGTIQVYAIVTDRKLTGCWATYPTSSDSGPINRSAIPTLCSQAVSKAVTSATVATAITNVSGASATSPAFRTSLQSALTAAGI